MELEKLTKSQIVLLTLLTSFVTSIATGIVTVTLMEEAPPAITQTVNRIVERTIEKAVPQEGEVAAAANVVTEKVVTVREGDLIANAVSSNEASIVRLFTPGKDETGKPIELFVGIAVVADESGLLIADAETPEGPLTALRTDGLSIPVRIHERVASEKTVMLQAATSTEITEGTEKKTVTVSWKKAQFTSQAPRLGETVVAVGGKTGTKIAAGIVTAISDSEPDTKRSATIETSIANDSFSAGSPLINADGNIIGIATRDTREAGTGFLASTQLVLYNTNTQGEQTAAVPVNTP